MLRLETGMATLSSDTDRRFVDYVIEHGLADPSALRTVSEEHTRRLERGEPTVALAQMLYEAGVLDRTVATAALEAVRAERAREHPVATPGSTSPGPSHTIGPYL